MAERDRLSAVERALPFAAIAETIFTKGKSPGTTSLGQLDRIDKIRVQESQAKETALDRELGRRLTEAQIKQITAKTGAPDKEAAKALLENNRIQTFIKTEDEGRKASGKPPLTKLEKLDIETDFEGFRTRRTESSKQNASLENNLRGNFDQSSKGFNLLRDASFKMESAATRGTAQSDMAMIFSFMKILDPTSTVREGEFATAQQTTGVPGQIVNAYNKAIDGKRLNEDQRQGFLNESRGFMKEAVRVQENNIKRFTEISGRRGLEPLNVIVPISPELQNIINQLNAPAKRAPAPTGGLPGLGAPTPTPAPTTPIPTPKATQNIANEFFPQG